MGEMPSPQESNQFPIPIPHPPKCPKCLWKTPCLYVWTCAIRQPERKNLQLFGDCWNFDTTKWVIHSESDSATAHENMIKHSVGLKVRQRELEKSIYKTDMNMQLNSIKGKKKQDGKIQMKMLLNILYPVHHAVLLLVSDWGTQCEAVACGYGATYLPVHRYRC